MDTSKLRRALERRSADELFRIVQAPEGEYRDGAVDYALAALRARGVDPTTLPPPEPPRGAPVGASRTRVLLTGVLNWWTVLEIIFVAAAMGVLAVAGLVALFR